MGAQPDTLTSTREVWHGVPQILAQVSVATHLATYLALLWQFFRFHRYRLRFAFPIRNSYPTDIPRKVPLNCQSSARMAVLYQPAKRITHRRWLPITDEGRFVTADGCFFMRTGITARRCKIAPIIGR